MTQDYSHSTSPAHEQANPDRGALGRVTAHVLAREAGERAREDARTMQREPLLADVAPQLVRSIGSIAANIAEGYARRSPRDRIRYYEYALGSATEAESWYDAGRHVLPDGAPEERITRLTSIRRLLLAMIRGERRARGWNASKPDPTPPAKP